MIDHLFTGLLLSFVFWAGGVAFGADLRYTF